MFIENIRLKNFRNHADSYLECGDKANIILGDNGEGKTNLLEAVSYISLTKSFYASNDSVIVNIGETIFQIEANMVSDNGIKTKIHIGYDLTTGEKVYSINNRRIEKFSSVIGKFPIVFLSPENSNITFGGPAERRKFLDLVLSQSNQTYFEDLSEYRKVVRHRNKILNDAKFHKNDPIALLEPWNEQLIRFGSRIMVRRRNFVNEFQEYIFSAYKKLVDLREVPSMEYEPSFKTGNSEKDEMVFENFKTEIDRKYKEELRLGSTLVGPHRDEISFKINGLELRKFASQGQHKTFFVALKIGEFFYLKERCRENPILLLDDVFSELDDNRAQQMLLLIENLNQTFITSTNFDIFDKVLSFGEKNKKVIVRNGKIAIS
ncbi:MAG: DNA replication/repair protein RecF [Bacteroidota bacterium]|nr:DNA replication/repair protein RecF [Bacteroidota bacterium]